MREVSGENSLVQTNDGRGVQVLNEAVFSRREAGKGMKALVVQNMKSGSCDFKRGSHLNRPDLSAFCRQCVNNTTIFFNCVTIVLAKWLTFVEQQIHFTFKKIT